MLEIRNKTPKSETSDPTESRKSELFSDESSRKILSSHSINALTSIEMCYVDPYFADFESNLKSAALGHQDILFRLTLTSIERMRYWQGKIPGAFNYEDILARAEKMVDLRGEEYREALQEYIEICREKYTNSLLNGLNAPQIRK